MEYFLDYEEENLPKVETNADILITKELNDNSNTSLSTTHFTDNDNSNSVNYPRNGIISKGKEAFSYLDSKKKKLFAKFGFQKKEIPLIETLDDKERKALLDARSELSNWVRLGPRAIQSYIFRYQLARELLKARNEFVDSSQLARNLARKLSGEPLETGISKNMEAVLNEVA